MHASVDLEGPRVELVNVLKGVDVLILTIRVSGQGSQIPLTDAAKAASVRRLVPYIIATVAPPKDVRPDTAPAGEHLLTELIDVGRWYQLSIPRLPSGHIDSVTSLPVNIIAEYVNTPSTLTDVRDVGRFTARIVADPRTINKMVLVYGAVLSQNQIFDMLDKMSGETSKRDYMGVCRQMTIFHEYWYSMGVRGDNTSEYADFLGYIDGTKLYPDFKLINFKSFLEKVLEGKCDNKITREMGSLPEAYTFQGIPQLTPLEQISPRGWVRYLFPFQLPEDYDPEAITDIFRRSLQATKNRFPTLACEALPDPDARQANALKLQRITDNEIEPVIINDLRQSSNFTSSFTDLKSKHFPVSSFPAEVFTRCPIWPAPGQRVPITIVQANFIRGGLILNWNLFHLVGDGQAFYNWIRVWAEETRRAQGLAIPDPVHYPDTIYTDRQIAHKSPQTLPKGKAGRLTDHPEYTIVTDPATQLAKIATTDGHVGQIFYLSKDSLQRLKQDAQPQTDDGSYVSTNDALSALIWRSIMAAQFDINQLDGSERSVFNIAIDGRGRSQPPIHPEAMGSFLGFIQVELPIKKILEADNLSGLSLLIRKAIIAMDKDFSGSFINDVVQLVNNQDDLGALIPTSFLDVPGRNCAQTSWEKFKMYDLDWGHALGGKIAAIRSPSCGILNGMQIMYPQHPDGGREMLVGIYENCLEKLCNDPVWTRYAERR
ncbi:hypothetical protein KHU50_003047 [Colletotrichum sp. SAR 10_65]|nr:hypothetical protein KHU50_003047 [Colletotrichum sp. SAR 10_65]KAI8215339.1 hypothetical protein K4K52_008185 [Colletotrichum sp. SAR 10_76]